MMFECSSRSKKYTCACNSVPIFMHNDRHFTFFSAFLLTDSAEFLTTDILSGFHIAKRMEL